MAKISIDINCDLGESILPIDWQKDAQLMPYISSANIACGGHAGNIQSMQTAIENCKKHNLKIGAHPSFPDRKNFGRVAINISDKNLRTSLQEQLQSFMSICQQHQVQINHIKPHGALYNLAAADNKLAHLIAEETAKITPNIQLMGLADSEMTHAADAVGIKFINEGFMDRLYHNDMTLVSRSNPLAVHAETSQIVQQALQLVRGESIQTLEGKPIKINIGSICLHGDTYNAVEIAKQVATAFNKEKITLQ